jgi:hypothetical protein
MIFSRRAVTGLLTLTGEQRASYKQTAEAAHEYGVTLDEAEEKSRGFKGQTQELKDDASDLGVELGQLTIGPLTAFVKNLRDIAKGAGDTVFAITEIGHAVGDLAGAVPGGQKVLDVLLKIEKFQILGTAGLIGRGVSSIVGHFRRGEKEGGDAIEGFRKRTEKDLSAIADAWQEAADKVAAEQDRMQHRTLSLSGELAVAEATGTQADQLRILRERQARQRADLQRKQERFASGDVNEAAVVNAANALDETNSAIASILSEQQSKAAAAAADAKDKADKIVQAQKERDDAFVEAINSERTRREARASAASSTEALGDDVRANDALRDFLRRSISDVRDRIRGARQAGRDTQGLKAALQVLRLAKADVRREIARLKEERREERDSSRVESAQLDVELATTRAGGTGENRTQASINSEVRARQRLIAALRKAQDHVRRGTNEWKRLRNEIVQEQAAIAALRKQEDTKQADVLAIKKQEFEFLQTLSGFTTNLIGNLIPGGATGLVGGSTPTGPGPADVGAKPGGAGTRPMAGVTTRPVSTAQGNTQIALLREIRNQLHKLNTGQAHPEAQFQRKQGSASGDFSYQGTHGM